MGVLVLSHSMHGFLDRYVVSSGIFYRHPLRLLVTTWHYRGTRFKIIRVLLHSGKPQDKKCG